jgi:uncharacterized protein YdeI (YjbR/CyaY-like superfamily)
MNDTPPDLAAALKTAGLADFFAGCTPAHRREYVRWIGEAKREETRKARIGKAVTMLADKCTEEKARVKTKQRR